MKKTLICLLALVLVLGTMTTAFAATTMEKIQKNGEIKMYTEAGFAPYEFLYNNEIVGVDVEIMKAVAAELGVALTIEDVSFDTICASVKSGKADVGAAGITITEERKESVDFSVPYTSTAQYVVVAIDNDSINCMEDLCNKSIGVQQGTTSDIIIESLISDGTLEGSTSTGYSAPAVAAASIGKIDAVVTDELTAKTIVANNAEAFRCFELAKADGTPATDVEYYGIAIAQGNKDLLEVINSVLNRLIADGTINAWEQEYTDLANSTVA